MFPLCQKCWLELPESGRLQAAGVLLNQWRQRGAYGHGDAFDKDTWDDHRLEVYTAIKGNL